MAAKEYPIAFWINGHQDIEGSPFGLRVCETLFHVGEISYQGVLTAAFDAAGLEFDGISTVLTGTDLTDAQFLRLVEQKIIIASVSSGDVKTELARDRMRDGVLAGARSIEADVISTAFSMGRIAVRRRHDAKAFALAHAGRLFVSEHDTDIPSAVLLLAAPISSSNT